jgi:dTDP-glucose 4,6-dehydratase
MPDVLRQGIRQDCLASLQRQPELSQRLLKHRIAVIGGTGFVGTWLAETITALNDELGGDTRVDLLGRSAASWKKEHPHLADRQDIQLRSVDVRSPFDLPSDVTLVLFAAGIADPRIHASDPFRVHETALQGITHTLVASTRLESLQRVVNISSGLVLGAHTGQQAMRETDIGVLDFTRVHNVYAESRRAAENLVSLYVNQHRLPVTTARAFTFIGPFQPLDAPWALNNFMRDALSGNDIRLHDDGTTRRSYLYGSDVAVWLLKMLIDGRNGEIYNLGGAQAASHTEVATMVAQHMAPTPKLIYKSQPAANGRRQDFLPDLSHIQSTLNVSQTFDVATAIERTMQWHARRLGVTRRLRP